MTLDYDDITYGIGSNIYKALEKAIENNSKETFDVIDTFVWKILHLSFSKLSINHFQQYISFPNYYYSISYRKKIQNSSLESIHKYCSKNAATALKYIIESELDTRFKATKLKKEVVNEYYYWAFNGFSQLLYNMVKNADLKQFKYALEEYDQISDLSYEDYYLLKEEIRDLQEVNIDGANDVEIERLKKEYSDSSQFQKYRRQVLLGIKYWILYLYQIKKLEENITLDFVKLINIQYYDSEDTIDDILFFRSRKSHSFMGWDNWDYTERKSGVVYSPPSPQNWLTFGFMIDQIRGVSSFINIESYYPKDLHEAKYLHDEFKKELEYLVENFDDWKGILNVENKEDLNEKSSKILSLFAALKRRTIGNTEKDIAAQPLSPDKITEFKNSVGNAWKNNARVRQLFTEKGTPEIIPNDIILKPIGHRVFYEKTKFVFIDGEHHQKIYGIDSLGSRIGRWEDDKFFKTIITDDHNKVFDTNTLQILIKAIAELKEKGHTPDLIVVSPLRSHKDRELFDSKFFTPKRLLPAEVFEGSATLLGQFDGIPMYFSLSELIKNRVLICDFKTAFKMKHKSNPEWFEGELKVDVNLISEDEAKRKLAEQPDYWMHTEDGIDLNEDDALTLIKTSVNIDCWSTVEFEILNLDAYLMGYVKTDNK
jgi:hypothetical protein